MRNCRMSARAKSAGLLVGAGLAFQFSGCDIGTITTTTTLDARDAIVQIVRGAILTPLDALITAAVNDAFGDDD